jgi:hypothetical protein
MSRPRSRGSLDPGARQPNRRRWRSPWLALLVGAAVSLLSLALAMEPRSAARKNDLAAALLVRGTLDSAPIDFVDAFELADEASAELVEARFNRALALRSLTLGGPARAAWAALARDGSRPAMARLAERWARQGAAPSSGATSPARVRNELPLRRRGERLLGQWGTAASCGDDERAASALQAAEHAAAEHDRRTGDRLLIDAVAAVRGSPPDRRRSLARGHAAYDRARGDGLYAECVPDLEVAERELSAAGSPFAGWARVDQAICAYFRKDFRHAYDRLASVADITRGKRYPALDGRVDWMVGLMRMLEGHVREAERALDTAADDFRAVAEPEHVAYLEALRAKTLDNAGEPGRAWQRRLLALGALGHLGHERAFTVLEGAEESLRARDRPRAALVFLDEQVRITEAGAHESPDGADVLALTLLSRAALRRELGMAGAARADLVATDAILRSLPPTAEIRDRIRVELAVQRAALDEPTSAGALAAVDRAVEFFGGGSTLGDWIEVLQLLRLRAHLDLARGDTPAAERDLRRSIAALERLRLDLEGSDQRARFLAHFRDTYEELLGLLLGAGRNADALELVEATSNRWWLDAAAAGHPRAPRRTRPGVLVLRFAHLRDRVLIWSIDAAGERLAQRPIGAESARLLVTMCREAVVTRNARQADVACRRAGELFLPEAVRALPAGSRLVLVTDELTQPLPFAALRATPAGPYLIERLRLAFAPSATIYAPSPRTPALSSALLDTYPVLYGTPHRFCGGRCSARGDAERYAAFYPRATELTDRAATRAAVIAALPTVAVAHISAHGRDDPESPERSGVLLAPARPSAPADDAILSARDLIGLSLPDLRLAILAGCGTDPRSITGGTELGGLATALLAAGARGVVTTGWDVDDALASEFFGEFHRCQAAGTGPEDCLRAAQLGFLRSPDARRASPRSWAGYRLFESRSN